LIAHAPQPAAGRAADRQKGLSNRTWNAARSLMLTEAVMKRILQKCLSPWVAAAIGVGLLTHGAIAGSFTRGCAARDLQILFLIEEQEAAGSVPVEKLSDALLEMMHARIVCHEGRVLDALAIYDAVAETLRPIRSGRAHADGIR
jgi:hypothetical protein